MQAYNLGIPEFKYHNIYFGKGKQTIPNTPLLEHDPRVKVMIAHLERLFPLRSRRRDVTIADLGPLEGGHSVILWNMGFKVFLLEARKENVQKLLWLRSAIGATPDRFTIIQGDVRNVKNYSHRFDAILCMGLLYHLDEPVRTLQHMMAMTDHILLSTHWAHVNDPMYDSFFNIPRLGKALYKRFPFLYRKKHYGLGYLAENEGVRGRWYYEFGKQHDQQKLSASSWQNRRSFWLCRVDLHRILRNGGYRVDEAHTNPGYDSSLFLCDKIHIR